MRFFKGVKDTYKKSEAAALAQNLLSIFVQNQTFRRDAATVANQLVGSIWDEIPQLLNGEQGNRPHKFTVAASAFAHAIRIEDAELPTSDSHIYLLCIGKILIELEQRSEKYPLTGLDHLLLGQVNEVFMTFSDAHSATPLAKEIATFSDEAGFSQNKPRVPPNPAEGLRFFQSRHRIDDAYLADILGESTPSGEVASDIAEMCLIVEAAIGPLQILLGGRGEPHDETTIGYLFGWLDVFKSHVWHVSDFNRSFFHYGFLLWFGGTGGGETDRFQSAMTAMTRLMIRIGNTTPQWKIAAKRGTDEAYAFLQEQKLPKGPHRRHI